MYCITFAIVCCFSFNLRHFTVEELKSIVLFLHDVELFIPWPQISFCRVKGANYTELHKHGVQTSVIRKGGQFWPAAHQFPAQNFKGKHNEHPLSRKISKRKLTRLFKPVKGNMRREKEN